MPPTTVPWPEQEPFSNLRIGGLKGSTPQGEMDDFAVWNRVLEFDEFAALYSSGKPIREVWISTLKDSLAAGGG